MCISAALTSKFVFNCFFFVYYLEPLASPLGGRALLQVVVGPHTPIFIIFFGWKKDERISSVKRGFSIIQESSLKH